MYIFEKMVNFDIVNYLVEGIRRGYDIFYLQEVLLRSRFPPEQVEEAVKYVISVQQAQQVSQNKNAQDSSKEQNVQVTKENFGEAASPIAAEPQTVSPPQPEKKEVREDAPAMPEIASIQEKEQVLTESKKPALNIPSPSEAAKIKISPSAAMVKPATPDEIKVEPVPVNPGAKAPEPLQQVKIDQHKPVPKFFEKVVLGFMRPGELFERTSQEGISGAIVYWMILSLVPILFVSVTLSVFALLILTMLSLVMVFVNPQISEILAGISGAGIFAIFGILFGSLLVFTYLIGTAFTFVFAVVHHLFARLYGGSGRFSETYKAMIYSMTPVLLFGGTAFLFNLVPMVGSILWAVSFAGFEIWTLVLLVIGISKNHNLSKARAFFVLLSVLLLGVLLVLALALLIVMQGGSIPSIGGNFTGNFSGNGTGF